MPVSNAQKLAKAKYQQEKRTLVAAEVSKDKGAFYREQAARLNLSLSMLIQSGVEEFIQRHLNELEPIVKPAPMVKEQQTAEKLTSTERTLLAEFNQLPVDAQKSLIRFLRSVNPHNDATQANSTPVDAPN